MATDERATELAKLDELDETERRETYDLTQKDIRLVIINTDGIQRLRDGITDERWTDAVEADEIQAVADGGESTA